MAGRLPEKSRVATLARLIRGFLPLLGVAGTRKKMIDGIEKDFKSKVAGDKNIKAEDLIDEYINEPEVMLLLKDLDMDESHLRLLANEAIKGVKCLE